MNRAASLLTVICLICGCNAMKKSEPAARSTVAGDRFQDAFNVPKSNFASIGRNDFFILEPGYQHVYEGGGEQLIITVLPDTNMVDGVEARVVEERESEDGRLTEVSRNFFAIDKTTGDVYYFGEDVDDYKDGKITSHGGAWISGVNGARFGLLMPAKPRVGQKYYQEIAPKVAMDRAEVVALDATMKTPAGDFTNCLKTRESSAVESGTETKTYARGVGLLNDGGMKLTRHGPAAHAGK